MIKLQLYLYFQLSTFRSTQYCIWYWKIQRYSSFIKFIGNDFMMQQYFQIYRIGLTSTSFSVAVQITGVTNLHILCVPYLAIQPSFPHHLNSFDNIPVNYSYGPLTNITDKSLQLTTFTNTINYTTQCGSRKYNKFNSTLQNYQILLFITSFFVSTTASTTPNYPLNLKIQTKILTTDTYYIKVNLKINVSVTRLHFSQLVFDQKDVESSNKYKLIYEMWQVDVGGGTKPIPTQFVDNFIMGLSMFQTHTGQCGFQYVWSWKSNATFFGVEISPSISVNNYSGFSVMISTVLYVKTWQCLAPYYYYNATSQLCQDMCGLYNFEYSQKLDIQTVYECKPCEWGCSKCNITHCISCNNDDMRLYNGSCYCPNGYLDTMIVTKCQKCEDPNCMVCIKNVNYKQNPAPNDPLTTSLKNLCTLCNSGYLLNSTAYGCDPIAKCNISNNQLLNYQTNKCQVCQIIGCLQCKQTLQLNFAGVVTDIFSIGSSKRNLQSSSLGVVSCGTCDQKNQYFKNLTSKQCQLCDIEQCVSCTSLQTCGLCNIVNQYFVNSTTRLCQKCVLQGCLNCYNLTHCKTCNNVKGYFIQADVKLCSYCGLGCEQCSIGTSSNICKTCSSGTQLVSGVCTCVKGKYISQTNNIISCQLCAETCKTCFQSSTSCQSCYFQQNRILNKLTKTCECNSTNYAQSVSSKTCTKINPALCDMGYYKTTNNQCKQICGDGVRINFSCDDGNTQNYDGCNSQCNIQSNFTCTQQQYQLSVCVYTGQVWINQYNIIKDPFDNILTFQFNLNPILAIYKKLNWIKRLYFSNNVKIVILEAGMTNITTLKVTARYFQNIKNKKILLSFISNITAVAQVSKNLQQQTNQTNQAQPPYKTRLLQTTQDLSSINLTFHFVQLSVDVSQTQNNLDVVYYPLQTYNTINMLHTVFTVIIGIYLGLMFIGLIIFKRTSPVLLTFILLQVCFLSLESIENVQPHTFSIINSFNEILGLNNLDQYISSFCENGQIASRYTNLGFSYCLLQNFNIMFLVEILIIVGILVSFLLRLKWRKVKKLQILLKKSLNNFLIFNFLNIITSISLMSNQNIFSNNKITLTIAVIQIFLTFFHFYFIFKYPKIYQIQIQQQNFIKDRRQIEMIKQNQQKLSQDSNERQENQLIKNQQRERRNESNEVYFNPQIFMFLLVVICYGCIAPILYTKLDSKELIFSNLGVIGMTGILIVVQIILKPFQSQNHLKKSFRQVKINYYTTYAFCILFSGLNIIFGQVQKMFQTDIQTKVKYMSYLSYIQISLFLIMLIILIITWSYCFYLSFFQDQIYQKYINKILIQTQKILHKKQQSKLKRKRSLLSYESRAKSLDKSTDFIEEINININPKNIKNLVSSPNYNKNLIYQIDEIQDVQNRF